MSAFNPFRQSNVFLLPLRKRSRIGLRFGTEVIYSCKFTRLIYGLGAAVPVVGIVMR